MELIDHNAFIDYNYIEGITFQTIGKHRCVNRMFPYSVAVTVLEGKYYVNLSGHVIELIPGETVFVPSCVMHDVWMEEEGLISYVHFTCRYMYQDILGMLQEKSIVSREKKVQELINEINHTHYESELLEKICKDRIIAEIILLLFQGKKLDKKNLYRESWLYQVLSYINNHIHESISVEELVELTSFSRTTFYKKFQLLLQMSPREYVVREKMNHAAILLVKGKKVQEVAEKVGFYDVVYFNKVFKRYFGTSPSVYKNKTNYM